VRGQEGDGATGAWWQRPAEACGPNEQVLAAGASAVAAARARVEQRLGYTCSAGIAPTKILAKLASGLHKPRQQTVVAFAAIPGACPSISRPQLTCVPCQPRQRILAQRLLA
jgi:nucleotidyltransferase/DNA polymerase involved in DNA repair